MDNHKRNFWGGFSFWEVLTIVFIVLKLCHVIEWSWLWVLSPIWIPIVIVFILILLAYIIGSL